MAQSTSADTGGNGANWRDDVKSVIGTLADFAIKKEQLKYVDVEQSSEGVYTPDRNDLLGGTAQERSAGMGGNTRTILMVGGGLVATVIVLKLAGVFK